MNVRLGGQVSTGRKAVWIALLTVFSLILFAVGWYRMFLGPMPPLVEALGWNLGAALVMWGIIVIAVRPRLGFPWSLVVLVAAGSIAILYGAWRTGDVLDGGPAKAEAIETTPGPQGEATYVNPARTADNPSR